MKRPLILILCTAILIGLAAQTAHAADCSIQNAVTNNSTVLTKALWDGEFGNLITCANARVEAAGDSMTGNLSMHSGTDVLFYSDAGTTQKASIDGSTGNASFKDVSVGATNKLMLDGVTGATYIIQNATNSIKMFIGSAEAMQMSSADVMYNSATANFGGWSGVADWLGFKGTGTNAAFLELTGAAADANGRRNAGIVFNADSQTSAHRTLAVIDINSDGATANARGGKISFLTKADSGSLSTGLSIDQYARPYFPNHRATSSTPAFLNPTTGELSRDSSARRYKNNIKDLTLDSSKIYFLRPVEYDEKSSDLHQIGLIAEEVDEYYPDLVYHNPNGEAESIHYDRITVLLLAEISKLNGRISDLEKQIEKKNNATTETAATTSNDNVE